MGLRPRWVTLAVALVAAGVTAVIAFVPSVQFAYRSPAAHIAVETGAALVGLLAGYLFVGRFRETRSLRDLLVATALLVFGVTNLFYSVVPAVFSELHPGRFATWAPIGGRLLGALALAVAALGPNPCVPRTSRLPFALAVGSALALAATAIAVGATASWLPATAGPDLSPETAGATDVLEGEMAVLAVHAVAMILFAAAAFGFARCAERTRDELVTWLAVASTVAAFARLNYGLFPSLYSQWVHTGDLFRLGFYVLLLTAAAREIGRYWRSVATAAVLDERRRVARDLHDGLAQELAFIVMHTKVLARGRARPETLDDVTRAAERALEESRRAIATLANDDDQPLPLMLADVADEVAARAGLELDLKLADEVDAPLETREALARIVREAVTNAAKHAHARRVTVELANGDGLHLRVKDDGVGFDPARVAAARDGRFGLTSMRERARALGGDLNVTSRPGGGTEIDLVLP